MGAPKPLVELDGRPLLAHVLDAVRASDVGETVVVLGFEADRVRSAVPLGEARVVVNPGFRDGMSSSLRAGVAALDPSSRAFFVVLGDAPFVRSSTYAALRAARARTGARIVLPTYRGVRGNPVLIDRTLETEVDRISGDRGCRALHQRHPEETVEVPVDDPGVVVDLDTPDDLARVEAALSRGADLAEVAAALDSNRPLGSGMTKARRRTRGRDDVFGLVTELERRREPFCLAIVTRVTAPTSGKPGFKAVVRENGTIDGWIGGSCSRHALVAESRAALADGQPRLLRLRPGAEPAPPPSSGVVDRILQCQSGGAMDIYLEPHGASPQLIVVGESAVAEGLSALGRLLGYRVVVVGPGLDPARFPDADEVVADVADLAAKADPTSYAVVATMAEYDGLALEALVRSPAPYVALVASRRRAGILLEELRTHGVPSDALARVRAPAGLDIGARTPEEIALSILAEIVERRRGTVPPPAASEPGRGGPATAVDPVCHMEVDPATTSLRLERSGTTYYFCAESCLRRFTEHPEEFLAR